MGRSLDVSKHFTGGDPVIYVDTVADLQALDTSGLVEGQVVVAGGSRVFEFRDGRFIRIRPGADVSYGFNAPADESYRTIIDGSITPEFGHRHFGGLVRVSENHLIASFRRAAGHGLEENTVLNLIESFDNGLTWSEETTIVPGSDARDQRASLLYMSRSGRIFLAWNDVAADTGTVSPSNPNIFRLIYSDDSGRSWSDPVVIDEVGNTHVSRIFGSLKEVPHDDGYKLIVTGYFATGGGNTAAVWYESFDNGLTWSSPRIVVNDENGNNETDMVWIDHDRVCAVARTGDGPRLHTSKDGGDTFTDHGLIAAAGNRSVAPSVNLIYVNGEPNVLIGFINRNANRTEWYLQSAEDIFHSGSPQEFPSPIVTGEEDMVNASGYQKPVFSQNGEMLFITFKEFLPTLEFPYSEVRLCRAWPETWAKNTVRSSLQIGKDGYRYSPNNVVPLSDFSPTLTGSSVVGNAEYSVSVGHWRQFGNVVTLDFEIVLSSKGGAEGQVRISGFPRRIKNGQGFRAPVIISRVSNYSISSGYSMITGRGRINSFAADLFKNDSEGAVSLTFDDIDDNFNISGSITYYAEDF